MKNKILFKCIIIYVVLFICGFVLGACDCDDEKETETETQEPYITSICTVPRKVEIIDRDTINEIVELFKSKEYIERKPMDRGPLGVYSFEFFYSDGSCVEMAMTKDYLVVGGKAYNIIDTELITELREYFYPDSEEE